MLRRLTVAIAAAAALGISFCPTDALARRTRTAVADSVPNWDLSASCRTAASLGFGGTPSDISQSCLASEQRTREELNKYWSAYSAVSPTYTELLTCLEMRRDVKVLRGDAKPTDTKPRP
jgi:hypothetical protein